MVMKTESILQKLNESPEGRKVVEGIETERLAQRQTLADEIAAIQAERDSAAPERRADVEKAQVKVDAAQEALLLARQALAQANIAATAGDTGANHRATVIEGELQASADMETIRLFTTEIDDLCDTVRAGDYTRLPIMERTIDGSRRMKEPGNSEEVRECLSQIGEVRREAAHVVVLEPLDKNELKARLNELRQTIVLPKM